MDTQTLLYLVPAAGALALIFAFLRSSWINSQDAGDATMTKIAGHIRDGAMAFLGREYRVLAIFVVVVAIALAVANSGREDSSPIIALSVVAGAICSGLAGFFGMRVATAANVRTSAAARTSLNDALKVAFSGGAVMGFAVVGLGVLGLSILLLVYLGMFEGDLAKVMNVLTGFSFGASSIALFARVGGGIYTKAADVGADLVGKVEAGIPEDDPRNPATIADNVGDNVGDVAGMGADLFESYVGSIIGSLVLGAAASATVAANGTVPALVLLPLLLAGLGIVVSVGSTFLVKTKEGGDPSHALHRGTFTAAGVMLVVTFLVCTNLLEGEYTLGLGEGAVTFTGMGVFWATLACLIAVVLIGMITEYYTSE
ncbi:MAG: sodium/proton-translocating pyrophosphatase, partial [Acidobacteriota bacterium]